jgi:hypothetical protein
MDTTNEYAFKKGELGTCNYTMKNITYVYNRENEITIVVETSKLQLLRLNASFDPFENIEDSFNSTKRDLFLRDSKIKMLKYFIFINIAMK